MIALGCAIHVLNGTSLLAVPSKGGSISLTVATKELLLKMAVLGLAASATIFPKSDRVTLV